MADFVRRTMEDMVPELEDLERRGFFSKAEIQQIVSRRRDFEYALHRRAVIKADFLRYVQYETSLEQLRRLRRKQRGIEGAATLADFCIVRRTHYIYERATRKFRGDLSLWARWLRFCQTTGSTQRMSRVLTHALQLHPNCPALWSYAAAWEFEHNSNAVAARALMQRGLRMCASSKSLWHEYFRLELLYAARLAVRRRVLGIEENDGSHGDIREDSATQRVLKGAVALVIYNNAVKAIPDNVEFRMHFLNILETVDMPQKDDLESWIWRDIKSSFKNNAGTLGLLARHDASLRLKRDPTLTAKVLEELMSPFEEHLVENATEEIVDAAISFLEYLAKYSFRKNDLDSALVVQKCWDVVTVCLKSEHPSPYSEAVASKICRRLGSLAAKSVEEKSNLPAVIRDNLGEQVFLPDKHIDISMLKRLLRELQGQDAISIWLCALRLAISYGLDIQNFGSYFVEREQNKEKTENPSGAGVAAACLLRTLWFQCGAEAARRFYGQLLRLPSPGRKLLHSILDCEIAEMRSSCDEVENQFFKLGTMADVCVNRIRGVFEAGVISVGDYDEELWVRYFKFEQRLGEGKAANIHWRALKALYNPDSFVARVQLTQAGLVM